jgi:monoamine oxidase
MNFADRLKQIEGDLSPNERNSLEGFLAITSGGTLENSGFFEALRWWALGNYDMQQFEDLCLGFKFRHGQSLFAQRFFDEANASGRLSYSFNTPVASVTDHGKSVQVIARDGRTFNGRKLVCTVPLNVLQDISFSPSLHPLKAEASKLGHCNQVTKVHFEVSNKELRSFSGSNYPANKLTFMFGDGRTPSGNTHLVAFGGSNPGFHLDPEDDIVATIAAGTAIIAMDVQRVVFHSWHRDEFAKGAWEWLKPGMSTKYIDILRQRQGNILFASADWAIGWRGFIDGAIEDGARAALEIKDEFIAERIASNKL